MKQAFSLVAITIAALMAGNEMLGYETTYLIALGATTIMALVIAGTFVWLWTMRATPLALGMIFSWTGGALVMGWWWVQQLVRAPGGLSETPLLLVFLAFYVSGAILHFVVIQGTLRLPHGFYAVMAAVSVALPSVLLTFR